MLDFGFYNMDCMDGMKEFPDKYFDLAIVDPPYGDGGGYMETHRQKQIRRNFRQIPKK
jgi:DNA modification methylase